MATKQSKPRGTEQSEPAQELTPEQIAYAETMRRFNECGKGLANDPVVTGDRPTGTEDKSPSCTVRVHSTNDYPDGDANYKYAQNMFPRSIVYFDPFTRVKRMHRGQSVADSIREFLRQMAEIWDELSEDDAVIGWQVKPLLKSEIEGAYIPPEASAEPQE